MFVAAEPGRQRCANAISRSCPQRVPACSCLPVCLCIMPSAPPVELRHEAEARMERAQVCVEWGGV